MIHKPPNPNNIDITLVNLLFGKDIDPLASLCNLSWYDRVLWTLLLTVICNPVQER